MEDKEIFSSPDAMKWPVPYDPNHPKEKSNILSDNLSPESPQLRMATAKCDPQANLGELDRLPLEIMQTILSHLDVYTLMSFESVNGLAARVAVSVPVYAIVKKHASDAVRGIKATQAKISLARLYEKLRSPDCDQCGDFGPYLSLLAGDRVCYLCFSQDEKYRPIQSQEAVRQFALTRRVLKSLPSIRSVPGSYEQFSPKKYPQPILLFDREAARNAAIALHGSLEAMEVQAERLESQKRSDREPIVTRSSDTVPRTRKHVPVVRSRYRRRINWCGTHRYICRRIDIHADTRRGMAIVHFPWLHYDKQSVEWGFRCFACRYSTKRRFSESSFEAHIEKEGQIRNGAHCH